MAPTHHPEVATTAIHGPDGTRVDVDQHLPKAWPRQYIATLIADRAARLPDKTERLAPRDPAGTVVDAAIAPRGQQ